VTERPRFLLVAPGEQAERTIDGSRRWTQGGERYREVGESALAPHGDVDRLDWGLHESLDSFVEALDARLPDADALVAVPWFMFGDLVTFGAERLDRAPRLKAIAGTFDFRLGWVDLGETARRGIEVIDTSRTMTWTVAEFAVGITLALLRDIPAAIDLVRSGEWFPAATTGSPYVFKDLAGCRVGLAGYGSINRHYRNFVAPYGCEVGIFDPLADDAVAATDSVHRYDSLADLARASDIFVVAIPPTPTTLGVIDAEVIDALAPGSLFVLVSRMAVVEQDALWRRLRAGEIRAAIDVYDPEPPPPDAWFRKAPNVLPTPHIAGNTPFAHERCLTEACADAIRVLNGERPLYAATPRDKGIYEGTTAPQR
jgi:phosphoglycerate dehydrogenase-like enzyme